MRNRSTAARPARQARVAGLPGRGGNVAPRGPTAAPGSEQVTGLAWVQIWGALAKSRPPGRMSSSVTPVASLTVALACARGGSQAARWVVSGVVAARGQRL